MAAQMAAGPAASCVGMSKNYKRRFLGQCAFSGVRAFFLKGIGKLRIVASLDITFGADGCPFKHPRLALSEPRHTSEIQHCSVNLPVLRLCGSPLPRVLRQENQLPQRYQHDSLR